MEALSLPEVLKLVEKLAPAEKAELIKVFQIEIVINELERREAERIELIRRLDDVQNFMRGMTR